MRHLLLLPTALYPDSLSVATQSQLTNAFESIIGLILGMVSLGFTSDHLGGKSGAVVTTLFLRRKTKLGGIPERRKV